MDDKALSDFYRTVRQAVDELDFTYDNVAVLAKVSKKTISNIVNKKHKVKNVGQVVRICLVLGLDPEFWLEKLSLNYTEEDITANTLILNKRLRGVQKVAFKQFGIDVLAGRELTQEWEKLTDSASHLYQKSEEKLEGAEKVVIYFGVELELLQEVFLESIPSLLKRGFRMLWCLDSSSGYARTVKSIKRSVRNSGSGQLLDQCRFENMTDIESAHFPLSFALFNPLSVTGPALVYPNACYSGFLETNRVMALRLKNRSNFGSELSQHGISLLERSLNPDLAVSDPVWQDVKDALAVKAKE